MGMPFNQIFIKFAKRKIMDIHAEKLELVRLILDTDSPGILASVKRILFKADFWDNLSQSPKDEIIAGITEVNEGETIGYEQ